MDVTVVKSGSNCAVKLKNVLIVVKDIEKAKVFYHQAMVCAHSFGEFDLENKIKKEMEKHFKK